MAEANLLGEWSWLLVDSLAAAGLRDVVISPGSRSTPFVVAVQDHPQLRSWHFVDERSAAFFALGQARATGRPSMLLCTSGTAGAHYLPAVIEAEMSRTPLLVLTADRPPELIDCGASQAIEQTGLFGDHVRYFADLLPEAGASPLAGLRRVCFQAMLRSRWPEAGAVHLNARARKPLEPVPASTPEERRLRDGVRELVSRPGVQVYPPRSVPSAAGIDHLVAALQGAERSLLVCGPGPLRQRGLRSALFELARRSGAPLLAEATSQFRFTATPPDGVDRIETFPLLLGCEDFRRHVEPELVIQVGSAPVAGAWSGYLSQHGACRRFVLSEGVWHDPESSAAALLLGDLDETLGRLVERLEERDGESGWRQRWREADRRVREQTLAFVGGCDELEEGCAVRQVVEQLPDGALFAVGNSLPVREVDLFCGGLERELLVWSQRGASGIDGLVSGVAGTTVALLEGVSPPPLSLLLLGDVSLLHDLGGLSAARQVAGAPFVIVVLNNGGGRIFEQLPVFEQRDAAFMEAWTTPHPARFAAAAELYGLPHLEARHGEELRQALDRAFEIDGPTLVEVVLDAASPRRSSQGLRAAVDRALEGVAPGVGEENGR